MKILMVNKFLYPKGGAETYVIKLGEYLKAQGNEVEYFGTYHENNIVKNSLNLYVSPTELNKISIKNIFKVFKLIYSREAKNKISKLLNQYKPDLILLNNIEYHLTPSIILAIGKYKEKNKNAKLFYVSHDYQLICPSHGLFDTDINPCEKCLTGNYWNCFKTKCLKNSKLKSLIGSIDSAYWHKKKVYRFVDKIICPSYFLKSKLDTQEEFKNKTVAIHNFVDDKSRIENNQTDKQDYIIYFGKLCKDKGVESLLKVAKELPEIEFVFAGYGPLEKEIDNVKNAKYAGFKKGVELQNLISSAVLSICSSEWYENCPFSVIEAQMYGTPVIGADIGGIPELISVGLTGETFEAKNYKDLKNKILTLWNDKEKLKQYSENCKNIECETLETYTKKLFEIYKE